MIIVLLTALGVGGATVLGAIIGFIFKNISHKFSDLVLAFAAGVMLAAAVLGLIIPSLEFGGNWGLLITVIGIFAGAIVLNLMDKLVPHLHKMIGEDNEEHQTTKLGKVLLFVLAIGIHNLPEGIAAGVGFGSEDVSNAITVAIGIALQNIPEGMIIVSPLVMAGVPKWRVFLIASFTGIIEIVGTLIGYSAVSVSNAILPFALAFAGGTMLYVVSDEMIPETHSHGYERLATYSLIFGFITMLIMDFYIG